MTDVLSRRDIDFLLYEWLDVTSLTSRTRFAEHSKDTFDAVLDLSADFRIKDLAVYEEFYGEKHHAPALAAASPAEALPAADTTDSAAGIACAQDIGKSPR